LTPEGVELEDGRFATEKTHVSFAGTTAWGDAARLRFHVTSADWQESDQLLAGILTDFGSPTRPVTFGGRGEFDGLMTGPFRRPRVEGLFTGEDLRAWDTLWGAGSGRIVIENSYVRIQESVVRLGDSEIRADGLFSLGYPRRDRGEEIDARFRVTRRDVDGVRHAFEIDDYPVSGLLTGEFHLTGEYERPIGFGAMTIENGTAYDEPFQKGTASLRFDGSGVRLDSVTLTKESGTVTGAAFIGWDGTYSFNAVGQRLPVDRLHAFAYPQLAPSGVLDFSAGGSGAFESPRYDVRYRITDLSVASEPVGQVTGTLALRGNELSGEVDVTSSRLAITGTGRIALTPQADAELTFRFHESSLDPYVRLFVPRLSPYTTAVASGSLRVIGELADVDHLLVDGTVDSVEMRLFDYVLKNGAPIRLALDQNVIRVNDLRLVGDDTELRIGGTVGLHDQRIAVQAAGHANLGILQGFFPNEMRGSGRAELLAAVDGPLYEPEFSGTATITNGRIRHLSMPNALDAINGVVHFDSRGVRLDDVTATMGGGRIQFGGRIGLDGYLPGELTVSARGENLQLRVPEGVRSVVDADLWVRGNFKAPTLGGTVTVKSATWNRRIDPTAGLFDFGSAAAAVAGTETPGPAAVPVRFDLEVRVPSTLRIENNLARLLVSADLQVRGTSERPLIFGRAEVDRGEVLFEGRRYLVTRGAIEFNNPARIEPFFDVEAETRVRVPGQTYRVIVNFAGTTASLVPQFSSDPPLASDADVVALLFSEVRREGDAELRARQNPNERQADILTTRATQLLASPLSSEVGRVVEQTFGVDTFQLTPSLFDPYSQSTATPRINPSARVTIGKRISDRVYLTFSRSLSTTLNDQILLLEYDESDRLSWILSRNEDQTYAIEVRVRHTF
jgi:translocation and assembly module TamB